MDSARSAPSFWTGMRVVAVVGNRVAVVAAMPGEFVRETAHRAGGRFDGKCRSCGHNDFACSWREGGWGHKSQIPSTKSQGNPKSQIPRTKTSWAPGGPRCLGLGIWCLGCFWDLVLGIWEFRPLRLSSLVTRSAAEQSGAKLHRAARVASAGRPGRVGEARIRRGSSSPGLRG
jgi:hypothetical protein